MAVPVLNSVVHQIICRMQRSHLQQYICLGNLFWCAQQYFSNEIVKQQCCWDYFLCNFTNAMSLGTLHGTKPNFPDYIQGSSSNNQMKIPTCTYIHIKTQTKTDSIFCFLVVNKEGSQYYVVKKNCATFQHTVLIFARH